MKSEKGIIAGWIGQAEQLTKPKSCKVISATTMNSGLENWSYTLALIPD